MNKKPNLLLVFSDQHRWCDLGCYGNKEVISPNLDAFAQEGLRFDQAYSNCPLCVPARGSLLTGLHALRHGAAANDLPIYDGLESIGSVLKHDGYRTGYVGKWHLAGVPRHQAVAPERRMDFDFWKVRQCNHHYMTSGHHDEAGNWHEGTGYEPKLQTDMALDFMRGGSEDQDANEPWGLVLSWGPPHDPYDEVPDCYKDLFDPEAITLRENVPEVIRPVPGKEHSRSKLRKWISGYYAHIAALDEQFGRMVDHLKQTGEWENTLVVYTSDHGDLLGSHSLTNKQMPFEESAHVPLIVGGGMESLRSGVNEELIGLVDLMPTLLGGIGLSAQSDLDGEDLSRLLREDTSRGLEEVYLYSLIPCHQAADRNDSSWRAIRTADYTYALNADTQEDWLLFDNKKDPWQRNNLLERAGTSTSAIVADLRKRLEAQATRHDACCPWPQLVRQANLTEAWNTSQRHFKLPELTS